jgi:hypothetical protein
MKRTCCRKSGDLETKQKQRIFRVLFVSTLSKTGDWLFTQRFSQIWLWTTFEIKESFAFWLPCFETLLWKSYEFRIYSIF